MIPAADCIELIPEHIRAGITLEFYDCCNGYSSAVRLEVQGERFSQCAGRSYHSRSRDGRSWLPLEPHPPPASRRQPTHRTLSRFNGSTFQILVCVCAMKLRWCSWERC